MSSIKRVHKHNNNLELKKITRVQVGGKSCVEGQFSTIAYFIIEFTKLNYLPYYGFNMKLLIFMQTFQINVKYSLTTLNLFVCWVSYDFIYMPVCFEDTSFINPIPTMVDFHSKSQLDEVKLILI